MAQIKCAVYLVGLQLFGKIIVIAKVHYFVLNLGITSVFSTVHV